MGSVIQFKKKSAKQPLVGVVVAARMTSVRFPGKHLALLAGKPVLEHCLTRCKQVRVAKTNIYKPLDIIVVLAVPDLPESEPLIQLAERLNVPNFCGSELDVLERMYYAALFFKLDIVIRVTGDCPFVDPRVCSECVQLLQWRNLDYVSNSFPKRTYPKGLDCEVFTLDCLEAAHKLSDTAEDSEHVTPWMQRTEGIKRGNVVQQIDLSQRNLCVDYPEDIERLEKETLP
jgi:spore coat polysaccharide biosynthesis protein SpsF (cytidylyltransferase family)